MEGRSGGDSGKAIRFAESAGDAVIRGDSAKWKAPAEPGPTLKLLPAVSPRWASREEQACGYE
jgi:hypothetical protein